MLALCAWPSMASAQSRPWVSGTPSISGTAHIGKTLTASGASAGGPQGVLIEYVWLRCDQTSTSPERCVWLTDDLGSTYTVTANDNNKYLRVVKAAAMWWDVVRGLDFDKIEYRSSAPTAKVTAAPTPTPTPTRTPVPTATPVKTPVKTPVPTATPVKTPVKTPVPTATPVKTPSPVVTVTPGGEVPGTPTPTPAPDAQPTPQPDPPAASQSTAAVPAAGGVLGATERATRMIKPYPVVRISGRLTTGGANITVLSVKAPKGATITVTCSGKGCPTKSVARATKLFRITQFQRVLPAGIKLRIAISKPGYITKVSTIQIRKGKAPLRTDQCQQPGESKLTRCPKGK
ncbi:hypothetical protein [Solirubrobacter deserti]|uniref:PEGA domain-containing protein n=1 Tax=Solirubrobacter deserti TaxID=2282478 RepID=A0ABT4RP01_9ACTN|nr:hypothetical protein [Solirubrobacter deserti]MDA0140143.1 hypothetical protein [Solirubrobacter deserti]